MVEATVKEEADSTEISGLESKVIRQIEYYFGDLNLPKDKFLLEELKKDNGWVPLEVLTRFNRLKELTTDSETICTALAKSPNHIIEISDDKTKIRRSPDVPMPENNLEYWSSIKKRTVYVKNFPATSTLDTIDEFFKPFGKLQTIYMRRTRDTNKEFKGSVFATFETIAEAKAFVDLPELKLGDVVLEKMFQESYYKQKFDQRKEQKAMKKSEKSQSDNKRINESVEEKMQNLTKGLVLHVTGLPSTSGTEKGEERRRRTTLKTAFSEYSPVAWIDYEKEGTEAFIRFDGQENNAAVVLEKIKVANDGKLKIGDDELEGRIIEGEEEETYWKNVYKSKQEAYDKKKAFGRDNRGRGGGRGGRGGRGGGFREGGRGGRGRGWDRGGKRDRDEDGPNATKKQFDGENGGERVDVVKTESGEPPAKVAKPEPEPVATKPDSEPVATKPDSEPVATKPGPNPAAIKADPEPAVTKPDPQPAPVRSEVPVETS